jgi:hypothetical protein
MRREDEARRPGVVSDDNGQIDPVGQPDQPAWVGFQYEFRIEVVQLPDLRGPGDWSFQIWETGDEDNPHPEQGGRPGEAWNEQGDRWLGGGSVPLELANPFDRFVTWVGEDVMRHLRENRDKYEARPDTTN